MLPTAPPCDWIPNSDPTFCKHLVRFIFIPLWLVVHFHEPFELKGHGIIVNFAGLMDTRHREEDPFALAELIGMIVDGEGGVFLDFAGHEAVHV